MKTLLRDLFTEMHLTNSTAVTANN